MTWVLVFGPGNILVGCLFGRGSRRRMRLGDVLASRLTRVGRSRVGTGERSQLRGQRRNARTGCKAPHTRAECTHGRWTQSTGGQTSKSEHGRGSRTRGWSVGRRRAVQARRRIETSVPRKSKARRREWGSAIEWRCTGPVFVLCNVTLLPVSTVSLESIFGSGSGPSDAVPCGSAIQHLDRRFFPVAGGHRPSCCSKDALRSDKPYIAKDAIVSVHQKLRRSLGASMGAA